MNKLPPITLAFWIMKIAATTLGETAGDLLSMTLHIGYAVSSVLLIGVFLMALITQLRTSRYYPWLYWTVILATSTAGTTISDYMDRTLGLGYATGSALLLTILLMIFGFWYSTKTSFKVGDIKTRKVELLYWTAVLFSNTLGTALGDFLADESGLGYGGGALLIATGLTMIVAAKYFSKIPPTLLFWVAFVMTRPFGATLGDLLTKIPAQGGLGLGTIGSSALLAAILTVAIMLTPQSKNKVVA